MKEQKIYECDFCKKTFDSVPKYAGHISNCKLNPKYEEIKKIKSEKLSIIGKKKRHSEETKKKLSEIRIKFLKQNPDKVPYKLNHSSKESYPEKYFTELFENEGFGVSKKLQIGLYELDFYIPNKKIDIEIDGSQHYTDSKIVESDKRRTAFLESEGWDVIRIDWAKYQKMNFEEKADYIKDLKNYINKLILEKPTIVEKPKLKSYYNDCECGNKKYKSSLRCMNCLNKTKKKALYPDVEILLEEIKNSSCREVSKKYGISDTALNKHIKKIIGGIKKVWINNEIENKKIEEKDLDFYLNREWKLGILKFEKNYCKCGKEIKRDAKSCVSCYKESRKTK